MKKTILIICSTMLFGFIYAACQSSQPEQISVMSFNIRYDEPKDSTNRWDNRKEACVNMLLEWKPDLFGIQEGLPHQVVYLDSALTQYAYIGMGRDSLHPQTNEYAAIFYRTDKFRLLANHSFWLSKTPQILSTGWDAKYPRIATWAIFEHLSDGKKILYLNTHLDHKGMQAVCESAKLIVETIQQLAGDSLTVFVTGDFNARPEHLLFQPILSYMKSAQENAPLTDSIGTTNGYGKEPDGKIIDYIFYRNATPIQYQTITKNYGIPYISDHYPIITTFNY